MFAKFIRTHIDEYILLLLLCLALAHFIEFAEAASTCCSCLNAAFMGKLPHVTADRLHTTSSELDNKPARATNNKGAIIVS